MKKDLWTLIIVAATIFACNKSELPVKQEEDTEVNLAGTRSAGSVNTNSPATPAPISVENISCKILDDTYFEISIAYKSRDQKGGTVSLFAQSDDLQSAAQNHLYVLSNKAIPLTADASGILKLKLSIALNKKTCGPVIYVQAVGGITDGSAKNESGDYIYPYLDVEGKNPKIKIELP